MQRLMKGEDMVPIDPWWRAFKGIVKTGENKYEILGIVRRTDDTSIEITEFSIHKWIHKAEQMTL